MREHNKRWLVSRMKTSGSKREYVINGSYADTRHLHKSENWENLPKKESFKSSFKFYNGKINYGLLVRFLRGKVGEDWDLIHSEIIARIPTKILHHKDMIYWFVADKVELIDAKPWNKKSQQFIWMGEEIQKIHFTKVKEGPEYKEFYVDPNSNKLVRLSGFGTMRYKK